MSVTVGHEYTSSHWQQDGAWASLPGEGRVGDFQVSLVTFGGYDNDFVADDLAHWIDYDVDFVRWRDDPSDQRFRTLQFEGDHVQIWVGADLGPDEAEALLMAQAPKILDLSDDELGRLWARMATTETYFEARGATEYSTARPAMWGYGSSIGRPDFERLYEDLGGLDAFEAHTHLGATGGLPIPGQVTLVQDSWEFHMTTAVKRLVRGSAPDGDLIWVAPTDTLQAVVWDRFRLDDAAAAGELQDALRNAGLDSTDPGWTFRHEPVVREFGQGD